MSPIAARPWIALAAAAATAVCGCRPPAAPGPALREPAHGRRPGEFSVATYNLARYTLDDRDEDGQRNDPKPAAERDAVASLLARLDADVLAVQEIGHGPMVEDLRRSLRARGLDYPHVEHAIRPQSDLGLAVFSRFPILERTPRMDDTYRIGATNLPVLRGFADVTIEAAPGYRFRMIVAHLKSKTYHPLGQTEMRRNEARLLANHVRRAMRENPALNLLVAGDLNDSPGSGPLQEVVGQGATRLIDLRPADAIGDAWTHHGHGIDIYSRIDYLLASPGMAREFVPDRSRAVRDPSAQIASDHRPVLAVFTARDAAAGPADATPTPTAGRHRAPKPGARTP